MPHIVSTEDTQDNTLGDYTSVKHDYDYPDDLDLKPGSALSKRLVKEITERALESRAAIANRFNSWNEIDRTLTSYIDLDSAEQLIKEKDTRKPVSIVYPHSYAVMETMLSYLIAAFFQEPMFRYEGVSSEDYIGALLMQHVIDLQVNKAKIALNIHTQFRDGLSYGFGLSAPTWVEKWGWKTVKKETGFMSALTGMFKKSGFEKDRVETILFEGNSLNNIDPYLSLPDPSVSIHELQDGNYFGFVESSNYLKLLDWEKHDEEVFNVKYLKSRGQKKLSIFGGDNSNRDKKVTGSRRTNVNGDYISGTKSRGSHKSETIDIIHMYIDIVPREWKLGKSEYPEKWLFSLAADDVIIQARPLALNHDMFPVTVCAPDFDGYSTTPISRLETLYGLQGTLDWMFNMHVANVRKAINDMFVYDPYLVNSNDLENPGAGKLIRLRKPAWGRGVKDVVAQLGVSDVTRGHIADTSFIVQGMDRVSGADSAAMGVHRQGGPERLTGAEFEGTERNKYSRMERIAKIIGLQMMQDLGYLLASQTQQLMKEEVYIKYAGRTRDDMIAEMGLDKFMADRGRMKVSPFDILVDYDLKVRDGSVPGGNYSNVWLKMFEILAGQPELAREFDLVKIFKHIARNNGAKNVEDFTKVKVMGNEQVAQQAKAGNVVPMSEVVNG